MQDETNGAGEETAEEIMLDNAVSLLGKKLKAKEERRTKKEDLKEKEEAENE